MNAPTAKRSDGGVRPDKLLFNSSKRLGSNGWFNPHRNSPLLHARMIFLDAVSRLAAEPVAKLWETMRPLVTREALLNRIKAGMVAHGNLQVLPEDAQTALLAWIQTHHLSAENNWTAEVLAFAIWEWQYDQQWAGGDPPPLYLEIDRRTGSLTGFFETMEAMKLGRPFNFEIEGWFLRGNWSDYEKFARAEFEKRLAEYQSEREREAREAGWQRAPMKYGENPATHFEMLVRWNVLGESWVDIATQYGIGDKITVRAKTGALRTRHAGAKEVRREASKVAQMLEIPLRQGRPGPRRAR